MCEVTTETKVCAACKDELPITQFYFRSDKGVYRSSCKKCKRIKTIEQIKSSLRSDTKICKHCNLDKPISEYNLAGRGKWTQPYCKPCDTIRKRKHTEANIDYVKNKRAKYYIQNSDKIAVKSKERYIEKKDIISIYAKEYRNKNLDKINERNKEYVKKNRNKIAERIRVKHQSNHEFYKSKWKEVRDNRTPEQIIAKKIYDKEYRLKNKQRLKELEVINIEKKREYRRKYQALLVSTSPEYKILKNLRSRIRIALLKYDTCKSDATKALLGCDIQTFRLYIESLFTEGMNWGNYGKNGWHIDHKIPCKHFDLNNTDEQKKCFSYTNMQPLWWLDNLKKGASIPETLKLQYA